MGEQADRFLELITAVADGRAVDWSRLEGAATTDADKKLVEKLRVVAAVGAAHRGEEAAPLDVVTSKRHDALHSGPGPSAPANRRQYRSTAGLRRWGRLQVFERIGEGAFGEVYRAFEANRDREVALKLMWPTARPLDEVRIKVFQEAGTLAYVRHPHVAAVFGVESHDDRLGIWMEYLRGYTLAQLLQMQGRFSAAEAILIGIQLCAALGAVHSSGFLHRDVKTQNVMREEGGRIVLTDFGAAQTIGGANRSIGGTPPYIAPEVLAGAPATPQSDLYSLAVLLFKLVTDNYPWPGSSVEDVRYAHEHHPRGTAIDLRPELPKAFHDALERALATSTLERYAAAGDFRDDLLKLLASSVTPLDTVGDLIRATPVVPATSADAADINVFVSYCHEDTRTIDKLGLLSHLKDLESERCTVWSDHNLRTGDDWNAVLMRRLEAAHIMIALVTPPYLRSRFCQEIEIKKFWERRVRDGLVVFPIIVSPCEWRRFGWLVTTQFLPRTGSLMMDFKGRAKRDQFMVEALGELRSIAQGLHERAG